MEEQKKQAETADKALAIGWELLRSYMESVEVLESGKRDGLSRAEHILDDIASQLSVLALSQTVESAATLALAENAGRIATALERIAKGEPDGDATTASTNPLSYAHVGELKSHYVARFGRTSLMELDRLAALATLYSAQSVYDAIEQVASEVDDGTGNLDRIRSLLTEPAA